MDLLIKCNSLTVKNLHHKMFNAVYTMVKEERKAKPELLRKGLINLGSSFSVRESQFFWCSLKGLQHFVKNK